MLRILTNNHHLAVTLYDLALFADFLNGRFYFHSIYHLSLRIPTSPSALRSPCNSPFGGVIDGNLHLYLVAG